MKQGVVKKKMLDCVIVGEKVILNIQTKNQMERVVMRRRINYLSVVVGGPYQPKLDFG